MKNINIHLIILVLGFTSLSWVSPNLKNPNNIDPRAAGCALSAGKIILSFNNVKNIIETGGILWNRRAESQAGYEVPKTPAFDGPKLIYSGALWMGGTDVNGQLKMAAQIFTGNGPDYWAGPLSAFNGNEGNFDPSLPQNSASNIVKSSGDAEIIYSECQRFDKFYTIDKGTVLKFIKWWECKEGLLTDDECDGIQPLSSDTLDKIINWPAHGEKSLGQDYYLAPFYDNPNGPEGLNGKYDPLTDGDYPWYDFNNDVNCRDDRRVTLFGDETNWWVFNDKGNTHQSSGGEPIGMEIRAQAFSFSTNDDINNMSFYNYEMVNRSTQTLFETYFAQYADTDIGGPSDDYVGCDVGRGLGYCFNGTLNDAAGSGAKGWGLNPPAIGIDFFEGPYQDPDVGVINFPGLPSGDNPLTASTPAGALLAFQYKGIPYEGLGLGYGDSIPDNERIGMRRFIYFGQGGATEQEDPASAADYYGFMRGEWKTSNKPLTFGGNGNNGTVPSSYMFPGESDPAGWATASSGGSPAVSAGVEWSEITAGNQDGDRRFAQIAGPFTLKPGALNNLTVGVVYGRSFEGGLLSSVDAMKRADTKAQSLFDACFEILEPPLAPKLTIQELENELILFLEGNNEKTEGYSAIDEINIPKADDNDNLYDRYYRFQGYQVFQMINAEASVSDIFDVTKARLVFQCDIKDDISKLVNYEFDEANKISIPKVKVNSANNDGLVHSFRLTEDLFAVGNRTLVNHKKYYYIAVSYGHNEYLKYDPGSLEGIFGQKQPYLLSRQSQSFGEIESSIAIPHHPGVESDGTVYGTYYGWSPKITQLEGIGNGGNELNLSASTISTIMSEDVGEIDFIEYENDFGPIRVKVVDPLNVQPGDYRVVFDESATIYRLGLKKETTNWVIIRDYEGKQDTVKSNYSIGFNNEQVIPEWGISVDIGQVEYSGSTLTQTKYENTPITSSIKFADSSKIWLIGVEDSDNDYTTNWIHSGSNNAPATADESCSPDRWIRNPCYYYDLDNTDKDQNWEGLVNGTLSIYKYLGHEVYGMPLGRPGDDPTTDANEGYFKINSVAPSPPPTNFINYKISKIHDVDIVITLDKALWTRCVVLEISDNEFQNVGGADVLELRAQASVDKEGIASTDGDTGMSWFPGYAINVNTGKRLNMAFGENSWLAQYNGADMIWNPTSVLANLTGQPVLGGMHYVYVFDAVGDMPKYDKGEYIKENLQLKTDAGHKAVFHYLTYVYAPLLTPYHDILECDVTIKARVNKPYTEYSHTAIDTNNGRPVYSFNISEEDKVRRGEKAELESLLDIINIVPNPYYAYSAYEETRIDNTVKITNLPERCNIKIFNMQGSLVRQYIKDDPLTSLNWDLTNIVSVPISSGIYIIHIEVPGVGEKILKWFGVMRKIDLDNI